MTAAEADARFDALVSDYRRGRKGAKRRGAASVEVGKGAVDGAIHAAPAPTAREATDATIGTLVVVIVFCLGVACGAIWPHRPFVALLVGIPLLFVARSLLRRWRRDGADG